MRLQELISRTRNSNYINKKIQQDRSINSCLYIGSRDYSLKSEFLHSPDPFYFGELRGEATIVTRRKLTEKEKLRSFLGAVISDAEKALKKLYPTREDILQDGQEKLYLLYIPQRKIEPKGKDYPIPAGEAQREWEKVARAVCKNRSTKTIPVSPFL